VCGQEIAEAEGVGEQTAAFLVPGARVGKRPVRAGEQMRFSNNSRRTGGRGHRVRVLPTKGDVVIVVDDLAAGEGEKTPKNRRASERRTT